jgi:hypothetical protein
MNAPARIPPWNPVRRNSIQEVAPGTRGIVRSGARAAA